MVLDHLHHLFWRRFFVSHDLERHNVGTYFRLIRVCPFLITYLKDHHLYQKDKSFRNLAAMYKGRWTSFLSFLSYPQSCLRFIDLHLQLLGHDSEVRSAITAVAKDRD